MWNVLDQMAATCGTLGTWNVLNQRSTAREMLKTYNILDLSPDVPGGILECVQDCRCVLTTANPHPKMHEGTGMALSCQRGRTGPHCIRIHQALTFRVCLY